MINAVPLILSRTLFRLNDELHSVENLKKFGSMYSGRNVSPKRGRHLAWIAPLVFFFRRTLFIIATVFILEQPAIQMIAHQVLSILAVAYISYDSHMFQSEVQRGAEIAAEVFLMLTSALIQQLMVLNNSKETIEALELAILATLGLFVSINITYLVVSVILNCKEANKKKLLEKRLVPSMNYRDANIAEIKRKF